MPRALVTGAASGIGLATARLLLAKGTRVAAVDVNAKGLSPLRTAGAEVFPGDVAAETDAIVRSVTATDGLDYLVNCAGIISLGPILGVTRDDWDRILAVNAKAVFFLSQALAGHIRTGGAIVNVSSSSAKLASTVEAAIYAASKAAVLSVTRSFAYALASRGIRVNAVCPGIVDTPMERRLLGDVARERGLTVAELEGERHRTIPLGRSASAEEIAEVIWFLLSDRSNYMTGQAINVTGGQVMW